MSAGSSTGSREVAATRSSTSPPMAGSSSSPRSDSAVPAGPASPWRTGMSPVPLRSPYEVSAVHADGVAAIASGGRLVVFEAPGGPHREDLWATVERNGHWGPPILITRRSPGQYNQFPAISPNGKRVVFDCGSDPYAQSSTQVCTTTVRGGAVSVTVHARGGDALRQPAWEPDGSIVYERQSMSTDGSSDERIWRQPPRSSKSVLVSRVENDNSPCVLPDGRIVSLWLGRPGNRGGLHEIKVMSEAGATGQMLLENVDVLDEGTGCGR